MPIQRVHPKVGPNFHISWLRSKPCPAHRSNLRPGKWLLSPEFLGRSGLFGPPLCGGSAPATPPPTTCLVDLVSTLVTCAQSKGFRQTPSRQSHQIPVGAGPVPAFASPPTDGTHDNVRPGASPASIQNLPDYSHPKLGLHLNPTCAPDLVVLRLPRADHHGSCYPVVDALSPRRQRRSHQVSQD